MSARKRCQLRRFARNVEDKINEQIRKERREAERMARAAAWEAEKAEAQANRVRCIHRGVMSMLGAVACARQVNVQGR